MNFNKYHVSRNLWFFHPNTTSVHVTLTWDGEKIVFSGTCSFAVNVVSSNFTLPKGTYTLKANANRIPVDRSTVCIDLYRASPFFQKKIENDVSVDGSVTFTIEDDMELAMRIRLETGVNYDGFTLKPMLNSGESSQTYEPYSSEVWHDTPHYIHNTSTDTITTPAVIYANDTTATVGLKGQMEQNGTPTPDSPIQPSECGERTGNLCDESSILNDYYTVASGFPYTADDKYRCFNLALAAGTYTLKATMTGNTIYLLRVSSTTLGGNPIYVNTQYTFTLTEADTIYVSFRNVDTTTDFTGLKVMLNSGSTALPYEPYGYKIPISSANTTTPVYLGEVETTRKVKKLVLTGEENVSFNAKNDSRERFAVTIPIPYTGTNTPQNVISSHLPTLSSTDVILLQTGICMRNTSNDIVIAMEFSDVGITLPTDATAIVNAVKTYLQQQYANGTPVTVWYVLSSATTGIVNEPLRKIGDYADTLSNISIPVTAGANTLSIGTTLQPSEVTVNYKGWHPVADVHERDSGQWD